MEIYAEHTVKKPKRLSDFIFRLVVITASGLISCMLFLILKFISIPFILILGFICYKLYKSRDIQYEYSILGSEFSVNKIIAKKKIKNLLTFNFSQLDLCGDSTKIDATEWPATIFYVSDGDIENEFFIDFMHSEMGNCRLIFSPNEEFISSLMKIVPYSKRA